MLVEAIQTMARAIMNDTNRSVKSVEVGHAIMRRVGEELRCPNGARVVLLSCVGGEVEVYQTRREPDGFGAHELRFEVEE
jgi:hypothetical protein